MNALLPSIDDLQSLVGPDQVAEHNGSIVTYPRSAEDVAAITRFASEHHLPLRIAGAGTKRSWSEPVTADLILSTDQLRGVREHVWQDLTATVAAGTPWSLMETHLAKQGQRVALDPLWPQTATVGGIVATNDSGALRSTYGSLRDLIIGMKIVLADGTIAKTGGKVVKNVAGYDLHKLMTGAFGTLGVITEVTFRLHPLPKAAAAFTIASSDIRALDTCRTRIVASSLPLESLQIRTVPDGFALDLAIASLPELIGDMERKLTPLVAPLQLTPADASVWFARERSFHPDQATVKITLSPDRFGDLILEVRAAGGECVLQQSGIMTATLAADARRLLSLRDRALAAGGSLTILHWPASAGESPDIWGPLGNSLPLMREIKRQFDPGRVLNPGSFVGGL